MMYSSKQIQLNSTDKVFFYCIFLVFEEDAYWDENCGQVHVCSFLFLFWQSTFDWLDYFQQPCSVCMRSKIPLATSCLSQTNSTWFLKMTDTGNIVLLHKRPPPQKKKNLSQFIHNFDPNIQHIRKLEEN